MSYLQKPDITTGETVHGRSLFQSYDDDCIRIQGKSFHAGISIHQHQLSSPWGPHSIDTLTVDDICHVFEQPPEVLLIGTGRRTCFPNMEWMQRLDNKHLPIEFMDSRSAMRTYNILIDEGRNASACILLPNIG